MSSNVTEDDLTAALQAAYDEVTTPPEGSFCIADIQEAKGLSYDKAFAALRRIIRAGLAERVARVGKLAYYRLIPLP